MKLALISLAICTVAYGAVLPREVTTFGLKEDLNRFVDLLPKEEIIAIAVDYLANDAEVQETFEYLQSEDFKKLITDVEGISEYQKFLSYLQTNGLNVYYYLQKLHEFLGLPEFQPKAVSIRRGKGVRGLIDDIKSVLPVDKIKSLYYELLESSPAFSNLVNVLQGDDFKSVVQALRANPEFRNLIQRAKAHGVDIELIVELLNKIFGWGIETRAVTFSLQDDIQDFLKLVPTDEILGIAMDYLTNDVEVQEVIEYAQSDDFKQLVQDVDKVPEYIQFLNYLQSTGLDVYKAVNLIHNLLGLDNLPVPQSRLARRGQGVRGMLDDILAALPTEQIKALFYEKLQTSPEFASLVNVLKGDEFKALIERLRANPTFQEIVARAKSHGVDVAYIVEILNKIFGWGIETRAVTFSLQDDLQDFLKLVPTDEILGIAMDYLTNDVEVQEVIEYAQSDDFKQLVQDVDKVPEYIQFLNYLQSTGLDVYKAVNLIHDLLGLDNLPVPQSRLARRGQGVRGMLDDILAALPTEQIKALFYEKLQTSPEFASLVNVLKGDEFKALIERLRANPTFQEIVARAKSHGVDVAYIVEILNKIFGWGIETRAVTFSLQDDLQDFLKLVPTDEILGIAMDYLTNDVEVQEVIEYAQSDDFKQLVQDVDKVPEYIQFLNYLQSTGLDVYKAVNLIHDLLGLDNLPVPQSRLARRGQGVRGMLDDILAALPTEQIKALFYEKLQTSPEFASLVNVLKGDEFKALIERLRANPTFQEIVARAKSHGVDVAYIVEILNKIFGWGIETRAVTFSLQDDLQDFLKLVPTDEILGIAMDYLTNDVEVQEVIEYAQSDDFKQLVQDVDKVPEYIQFLNYLQSTGLDVYKAVNLIHDLLGLDNLPVPQSRLARRGQGVRGMLDDILAALPTEQIKALFYEKLQTSPEFASLVNVLKGDEFKALIERLRANPTFQEIVARAKSHGVDVAYIVEILNKIFGWGIETRAVTFSLQDDLQDFLKLVPTDEILGIAMDYLTNDVEVQEVIEYAQSDDFKQLVQDVDKVPEYIQFLNYLQSTGLDVYKAVNLIHDLLGLDNLPVPQSRLARRGQGVRGMLDDILAALPTEQIKALYYEKLESSPEFASLVNLLKGEEFKGLIERLRDNPIFQEIVERAKSHGIDVARIIEILNKIFGWGLEY